MAQTPSIISEKDRKVLDLLKKKRRPLSAYELLALLRPQGVRSPPTVYRSLERLRARGVVHRLESLNAFMACAHEADDGAKGHLSAFAICTECGQTMEIHSPSLARSIKKAGRGFLVDVEKEVLEISGLCESCVKKGKKAKHV